MVLHPNDIVTMTAKHFRVPAADLTNPSKLRSLVQARHAAMWACRRFTQASYVEIGWELKRDHTTVILAVRKVEHELSAGTDYSLQVRGLEYRLNVLQGIAA